MKWIKILSIPVVIIIILIIALLVVMKTNKQGLVATYIESAPEGTKYKTELVTTKMYYTITECCNSIIQYAQKEDKAAIYSLLNSEYKSNNNITLNGVFETTKLNSIKKYKTLKIYRANGDKYSRYFIQGITDRGYIYFNINVELATSTYDFMLLDEASYMQYIQMEVPIFSLTIAENVYNKFPSIKYSDMKIAEIYFNDFIENAIDFPEIAYNSLDKEYRDKKFGNIQSFKNFVANSKEIKNIYDYNKAVQIDPNIVDNYAKIGMKTYKKNSVDGHTEYAFTDTYGNIYTFKVTSIMQYTVVLDN